MILTVKETEQFNRVLQITTYRKDGKAQFTEEATAILEELAVGFHRIKIKDKYPEPNWIERISAADAFTHMLTLVCEAHMGLAMEMSVVLWVPIIADKLQKERQ